MVTCKISPTLQPNSIYINGEVFVRKTGNEPVLALTSKEKEKIANLYDKISNLELELYNLSKYYSFNLAAINRRDNRDNAFLKLKSQIESYKNQIYEIRKNRYQKQKEELNYKY